MPGYIKSMARLIKPTSLFNKAVEEALELPFDEDTLLEVINRYTDFDVTSADDLDVQTLNTFLLNPQFHEDVILEVITENSEDIKLIKFNIEKESDDPNEPNWVSTQSFILNEDSDLTKAQKEKLALSVLASFMERDITLSRSEDEITEAYQGSDVEYEIHWNIVKANTMSIESVAESNNANFAYFAKVLPYRTDTTVLGIEKYYESYAKNFKFNDNDDLFCPFSALYEQDINDLLPRYETFKNNYMNIYFECGFVVGNSFNLHFDDLIKLYKRFFQIYNIQAKLTAYYMNKEKNYQTELSSFSRREFNYNEVETDFKFIICRMRDHVFNINHIEGCPRGHILRYLRHVNNIYDTLPYKKFDETLKQKSNFYAKEYKKIKENVLNNPHLLLKNVTEKDFKLDPEYKQPKSSDYAFVFDLETHNVKNEAGEDVYCIYSYYIKCISHKYDNFNLAFYFTETPIAPNPNTQRNAVYRMMLYVTEVINHYECEYNKIHKPDKDGKIKTPYVTLFSYNGAKFDTPITLNFSMVLKNFSNYSEIDTGPGGNIMLSCEASFNYYQNNKRDNSLRTKKNKDTYFKVSFRDAKKVLGTEGTPVSELPTMFGFNSFKLTYDYDFYENYFKLKATRNEKGKVTPHVNIETPFYGDFIMNKDYTVDVSLENFIKNKYYCERLANKFEENGMSKEFFIKYCYTIFPYYFELVELNSDLDRDIDRYCRFIKGLTLDNKIHKCFDIKKYCWLYNKYDVIVVEDAMKKMEYYINSLTSEETIKNMIRETAKNSKDEIKVKCEELLKKTYNGLNIGKINIADFRSSASLVFHICQEYGVYKNVPILMNGAKKFCQLGVVGGRVSVNKDKKHFKSNFYDQFLSYIGQVANEETNNIIKQLSELSSIVDFDAVSLYPSAIHISEIPAGIPKIYKNTITEKKEEFIKAFENYIWFACVDIEINEDKVFPILSELVTEDGQTTRNFRYGLHEKIVISSVTYKELLRTQKVNLIRIHAAMVFPEKSTVFREMIDCLFNLRLIFKSIGLNCQEVVKLIMNSSYGRTILKAQEYKKKYYKVGDPKSNELLKKHLSKNFHKIKPDIVKRGNYIRLKECNPFEVEKGYPHVGMIILDNSKVIMNKVMAAIDSKCYYTDTDSMHIELKTLRNDVDKNMVGKQMGQFHSDFAAFGANPIDPEIGLFAIESMFIMKKCYFDELFGIDKKTNKYKLFTHQRVKGVPNGFMNKENYYKLLNGEVLECQLCEYMNMITKVNKAGELIRLHSMTRSIKMT